MNRIDIRFIPEEEMRYSTLGDWYYEGGILHIRASDQDGPRAAFLVALHELCEAWLCHEAGIGQEAVDLFDLAFVASSDDPDAEPGDLADSPYRIQHRQAMMVEHLMALFCGVSDYGTIR